MCAQGAKQIADGIAPTRRLLEQDAPVYLVSAPSLPAAYPGLDCGQIVAAAKKLGFTGVLEVAYGAELVAKAYHELLAKKRHVPFISTPCPAVVAYIQKHLPALIPHLAPIVSPMIAIARAVKREYHPGARVVFVGPCVAKKLEALDPEVCGDVDEVLTFDELEEMIESAGIVPRGLEPGEFDGPEPTLGRLFPLSGGLIRTAALEHDILKDDVVVIDGRERIRDVLVSLERELVQETLFDLLLCEGGCINGPVIYGDLTVVARRRLITAHARRKAGSRTDGTPEPVRQAIERVSMRRSFRSEHIELPMPSGEQIREILRHINKYEPEDELNCGACGYASCREKAIAVYRALAENEMCLPYIIEQLTEHSERIKREAMDHVLQAEKLASIGRLAAGIAHEINNPLGGILMYAGILMARVADDNQRRKLQRIIDETVRCRDIVKSVLEFSRQTKPEFGPADVRAVLDVVFDLISKQPEFQNIELRKPYRRRTVPAVNCNASQLQQVLLNIIINAAQAIDGEGKVEVDLSADETYVSTLVRDSGCGIPQDQLGQIFDPFYTTKGAQKGTGLGLSTAHGIVESHQGHISVESVVGRGSLFVVRLPTSR